MSKIVSANSDGSIMIQADSTSMQQGHYVTANGLNIYYEEYGSGQPLILLHGGTLTSRMWQRHLPSLIPQFRVITPHSRGHGKTNNPEGKLSYRLMADDMAAFIQALHLTPPLVFGYSDGGQIALEMGMRYPGLTTALAIGAAWYKFSDTYLNAIIALGFESPGVVNLERMAREYPEWVEHLKTDHARADDPDYWQTLLDQISAMFWTPLNYTAEDFQKVTEPTLIAVGDRDEAIALEQAIDMYRFIPKAELAIFPNSTHWTALSKLMIDSVLDFFLRHSTPTNTGAKNTG